uniref:Uncharacterized protein n=1 Tax=Aegilops tauschii subsp. strangulata TaxID=200361 RepID=A0A452YAI8_AEGTS
RDWPPTNPPPSNLRFPTPVAALSSFSPDPKSAGDPALLPPPDQVCHRSRSSSSSWHARLLPPPGTRAAIPAPPSSSWHVRRRPRTSFLLLASVPPPPHLLPAPSTRAASAAPCSSCHARRRPDLPCRTLLPGSCRRPAHICTSSGHRHIFSMLLHHSGGKEATVTTPTYFFLCCYIAGPNCGEDAVLGVWQVVCVHTNWRLCVCRVHQVGSQCTRE